MKQVFLLIVWALISAQASGQIYQMDVVNGTTVNTCSGTFFDSEAIYDPASGEFAYDVGENYTVTFCSPVPGSVIRFDFDFLQIVSGEDTLWVYDGPSTASPLIAVYSGGYSATSVIGSNGCLTFVFISTGSTISYGWEAAISCFTIPPTPTQPACTNIGFENGNFGGWFGTYGIPALVQPPVLPTPMNTGPPGAATPTYIPDVYGSTAAPHHTITSGAGVDPYGGFPVVSPTGGTYSMMLGDFDNPYYGGSSIEQKFNVTPSNAMMIYSYAVVLQDAAAGGVPHAPEEQPYFQIEAFDCAGNSIPCGDYLVVGGAAIPGFTLAPGFGDVYYKPWTDVFLDLTPYIGSCVTVRFTQGDCTLGAHYSYVYLDAICGPLEITGPQWICPGEFVTLVAPPGGAAYSWTPGGQTTQTISVSPAAYTDYTCTVTPVTGPACTTLLDYWVDVYPPASVAVNSDTVCSGTPVNLTAVPNSAGGSFSWNPGGQITQAVNVSPLVPTNYVVTFTDANGCEATATAVVGIIPAPSVTPIADVDVCVGDQTSAITITGPLPGTTFTWTNSNPAIGLPAAGAGNIPAFTALNPGGAPITATITVTPDDGICPGVDEVFTITVHPLPNVFAGNPITICEGAQVVLTGSGAMTYDWNNGAVDGVAFVPVEGWYTVIGTDVYGCVNVDSVLVGFEPLQLASFVADVAICEPFTVTLTSTTPGNNNSCVWNLSNGAVLNGCGPITYTFPNAGTYDVTLTTTSSLGCVATVTYVDYIEFQPSPIASFNPSSSTFTTLHPDIQFHNTSTGAVNYLWTFGDASVPSTEVHPLHTFPDDQSGTYLITLIAYSPVGCADTAYGTVIINEELLFYVPNTFTPDGDNFNQFFQAIFSSGYDPFDFHFMIFNRWGEIIWESYDDSVGWDGTYHGKLVQDGTYTWKIDFKTSRTDERMQVTGHVNVIR